LSISRSKGVSELTDLVFWEGLFNGRLERAKLSAWVLDLTVPAIESAAGRSLEDVDSAHARIPPLANDISADSLQSVSGVARF
jgi:hypothetical protein